MKRTRHPLTLLTAIAAGLLLLASGYLWLIGAAGAPAGAGIGGPFSLTAGDGRPVTERTFRGKYLVIYFGYTACRDVCPMTLANLAAALDSLGEAASRVQPLFITVDPARDTPEVVQRYASSFMPGLIGLTGSAAEIRQAAREYRISSVIHPAAAGGYDLDHSSVIYLVGRDGKTLAALRADATAAELARAISRYLS